MQNRREFLKQSCSFCIGLAGLGTLAAQLSSCASLPVLKAEANNGRLAVPFASFTEKSKVLIVRNPQLEYDIALVKNSDSDYTALQMKCTHQDNALTVTQSGLYCASHGSSFDLHGNVLQEPALAPLKKYKTEISNTSILIIIK